MQIQSLFAVEVSRRNGFPEDVVVDLKRLPALLWMVKMKTDRIKDYLFSFKTGKEQSFHQFAVLTPPTMETLVEAIDSHDIGIPQREIARSASLACRVYR